MSHVARFSFRENPAKRVDRAAAVRIAHAVQPQERKGEAVFHNVRGLSVWNGKDGEMRRTAAEKTTGVIAGNGMLGIG